MTISIHYYYKIFTVLGISTSLFMACTKEKPSLDDFDPLFQVSADHEQTARLIAQPITSSVADELPHLTPFVGHLIIGNQLVQAVIAGVPPLPYPSNEHPLILQIFQKAKGHWHEMSDIPEVKLGVRSNSPGLIQPVALQHELSPSSATIRLRYGDPNTWQQEALLLQISLHNNENRIQLRWHRQLPSSVSRDRQPAERRYQLRVGLALPISQNPSFEGSPGNIHVIQNQMDSLALIDTGTWQAIHQENYSWLVSRQDAQGEQEISLDIAVGRFGLMELGARYLPKPQCAFVTQPLPSFCVELENTAQTRKTTMLVPSRTTNQAYFASWPLIELDMPGLNGPLHIPAEPRESITMHLPVGSKLSIAGTNKHHVIPAAQENGAEALTFRLEEDLRLQAFPITALGKASRDNGLLISLRSAEPNRALKYHAPAPATEHESPKPALLPSAIALQSPSEAFALETGRYLLSVYHDLGLLCQEILEVSATDAIGLQACRNPAAWSGALKTMKSKTERWKLAPATNQASKTDELKALELVRHPSSGPGSAYYEFFDPNFALSLRILDSKADSDLTEAWQNYRRAQRSASIFSLRHFLAAHAPAARLELSCPHQPINVHDFESTAKALNAHIFAIFSCHDPAYEDQLFQAVDRLQANRDQVLSIVASQNQGISFLGQRGSPKFLSQSQGKIQTLGAGAAVQILELMPYSAGNEQPAAKTRAHIRLAADLFSQAHRHAVLRVVAIQQNGQLITVAEQAWHGPASNEASPKIEEISLELPAATSYLRAELVAQPSNGSPQQKLRLATSQYWPVKAAKHAQRMR